MRCLKTFDELRATCRSATHYEMGILLRTRDEFVLRLSFQGQTTAMAPKWHQTINFCHSSVYHSPWKSAPASREIRPGCAVGCIRHPKGCEVQFLNFELEQGMDKTSRAL